jgi:hypothetical protein
MLEVGGGKGMMGEELDFWLGNHLFQTLTMTCICWWALVLYYSQQNKFFSCHSSTDFVL